MRCVIHWFRRDLRIADNPALFNASQVGLPVIPVYFPSRWHGSHPWTGVNRQHFLCGALASLANNLETIGGRLLVLHSDPVDGLERLIQKSGARAVCFNKSPDPYGKIIENRVVDLCKTLGLDCHAHEDAAMHGPDEVLTQTGQPYRVYTPYSRNWLGLPKQIPLGLPRSLNTPPQIPTDGLPDVGHWGLPRPSAHIAEAGERAARERLKQAIRGKIQGYGENRDFPARGGTSRISQDLRHGTISIRTVYAACLKTRADADAQARANIDIFIKELAWREFYFAILHHYPNVLSEEFHPDWRGLPWDGPGPLFERWQNGLTGFPIVDAGMRELLATGHMHNRVRMITAMFLTKDLHVDWKLGESHFMQHLVDGEIASNNGGWQWSAGTGADAAPYFRIQNPWSQGARYDAQGEYIKRWIPELAGVAPARLHSPPADGKPLAADYPLPCVDHALERNRTLEIFKRHRAGGRQA
jgi:deoxyribodipyrimidine photo-lyase